MPGRSKSAEIHAHAFAELLVLALNQEQIKEIYPELYKVVLSSQPGMGEAHEYRSDQVTALVRSSSPDRSRGVFRYDERRSTAIAGGLHVSSRWASAGYGSTIKKSRTRDLQYSLCCEGNRISGPGCISPQRV